MSWRVPKPAHQRCISDLVEDRVEESHAARFFLYVARSLRLSFYSRKQFGASPYDRPTMVALILFALFRNQFSADAIWQFARENLAAIWILRGMDLPSAKTIERTMAEILLSIDIIFQKVLELCCQLGLVGHNRMYIDGKKTKANASKHKAMSYKRLCEKLEAGEETLAQLIGELQPLIENLEDVDDDELQALILSEAEEVRQQVKREHKQDLHRNQEAVFGGENAPAANPAIDIGSCTTFDYGAAEGNAETLDLLYDLGFKAFRVRNMQEARDHLEAQWQQEHGDKPILDKAQVNFTDPESSIMQTKHHGAQQCYNHYIITDAKCAVIIGAYTSNSPEDQTGFRPTVDHASSMLGSLANWELGTDAGFFSAGNIRTAEEYEIDLYCSTPEAAGEYAKDKFKYDPDADCYTCPEGHTLKPGQIRDPEKLPQKRVYKTDQCQECPVRSKCTRAQDGVRRISREQDDDLRDEMKEKASSAKGREILRLRKAVVEPVWGNMVIQDGLTQMHYRGLDKVSREFLLRAAMHNLRKAFKAFSTRSKSREECPTKAPPTA